MYTNIASANDHKNGFNNTEYQEELIERQNRNFNCGVCGDEVKVMEGIDVHNLGISNTNSCLFCKECFLGHFDAQFEKMENMDSELTCPFGENC